VDVLAVVGVGNAPHALAPLGGVPVLVRSVRMLLAAGIAQVTVLVPEERRVQAAAVCSGLPVTVRAALAAEHGGEVVVVHDAVRPLAPPELAVAVLDALAAGHRAAVPVLPLTDTVKRLDGDGCLHGGVDRDELCVVQTPAACRAELLGTIGPTGPAGVVRAGVPVHTVAGHPMAFPLRTPADLRLAEAMLAEMIA
jgi:2-C-methyl-D-erythritol 4-phosphate cytidylyltransferase